MSYDPWDLAADDEEFCEICGHALLWDEGERMWYCPNTWEHG